MRPWLARMLNELAWWVEIEVVPFLERLADRVHAPDDAGSWEAASWDDSRITVVSWPDDLVRTLHVPPVGNLLPTSEMGSPDRIGDRSDPIFGDTQARPW